MKTTTTKNTHAVILAARSEHNYESRVALFSDMLACFGPYNIRIVGTMKGAILVENATGLPGPIFSVCDNGGEMNVAEINSRTPCRSAAYMESRRMIDGATLAYRVRQIMDGAPIDCALDLSSQLSAIRAA